MSSAFLIPPSSPPQPPHKPPTFQLLSAPGASKELVLNKKSSLRRECQAIHHDGLPIGFIRAPIVTASLSSGNGAFVSYEAHPEVECSHSALRAVEIRYLLFNVWGERMHTLSAVEILDMPPHSTYRFDHSWSPFRPSDVDEFFSSIAFIARVLDSENYITAIDSEVVVEAARKIASGFDVTHLTPRNPTARE